jgi:hypothetical protein
MYYILQRRSDPEKLIGWKTHIEIHSTLKRSKMRRKMAIEADAAQTEGPLSE